MSGERRTKARHSVLVVDDEPTILVSLRDALRDAGYEVTTATSGDAALATLQSRSFDVVVSDVRMPGLSGMDLLAAIRELTPNTRVVLMTAYADVDQGVAAIKMGAYDYITKPFPNEKMVNVVGNLSSHLALAAEVRGLRTAGRGERRLVGRSRGWRRVEEMIATVAETDSTVLVVGESGTGKELVTTAIHENSGRREAPFVKVHCAALPSSLIESELFGHERGAFTGAVRRSRGRFEAAHGGTLLLDEVDEIPLDVQVKLLRVLQERTVERVGSMTPIPIDVRILATTKEDISGLVDQGRFRPDLYYRLAVIRLPLPPLREREGDVDLLLHHFLDRFRKRLDKAIPGFSERALEALRAYEYPGNVRELEHVVEAACALVPPGVPVSEQLLPAALRRAAGRGRAVGGEAATPLIPLRDAIAEYERTYLANAVGTFTGSRGQLAERLGISRKHLWHKLKDHGIDSKRSDA